MVPRFSNLSLETLFLVDIYLRMYGVVVLCSLLWLVLHPDFDFILTIFLHMRCFSLGLWVPHGCWMTCVSMIIRHRVPPADAGPHQISGTSRTCGSDGPTCQQLLPTCFSARLEHDQCPVHYICSISGSSCVWDPRRVTTRHVDPTPTPTPFLKPILVNQSIFHHRATLWDPYINEGEPYSAFLLLIHPYTLYLRLFI
jgi:hypothetical protein